MFTRRVLIALIAPILAACASAPQASPPPSFQSERISVTVEGAGPDVILVPGLGSEPGVWRTTVQAVPGYRYHLVQVNGFAGAPVAGNADGPVLAPVAEEIARYAASLDRPAIIGHSLGGSLAMLVAARHPQSVSKVMVVDMLPFMGMMFGPPGTTVESVTPIANQVRVGMLTATPAARRTATEQSLAGMIRTESARAHVTDLWLASDQSLSARSMYDLITTDLRPELANIAAPLRVLYVRGPNIPLTDEQMDAVYRVSFANAPSAMLKRMPDAYHFIMIDQHDAFAAEVRAFLGP